MERKEAIALLRGLVGKDAKAAEALAALEVVRHREAKEAPFLACFTKPGDTMHEDAVFSRFKLGRRDAYWVIADAIKLQPHGAEARKWIHFTEADGLYTLVNIGPKPGPGYAGYIPKAERAYTPKK